MADNRLYKSLNSAGYYTKSEEEFNKQFGTPEGQSKLYGALNSAGHYTKSEAEFKAQFFSNQLDEITVNPQQEQSTDYGPFDSATVAESPQAKQNYERWKTDQEQIEPVKAPFKGLVSTPEQEFPSQKPLKDEQSFSQPYLSFEKDKHPYDLPTKSLPESQFDLDYMNTRNDILKGQTQEEQAKTISENVPTQTIIEEPDSNMSGFGKELGQRAQRSGWNLNEMLVNTPDFINRIAVEALNLPIQGVGKLAEVSGLIDTADNWKMVATNLKPEKVNEYIQGQKGILTSEIAKINPKHNIGIVESAQKGDWASFTRNLAGGVADSFAPSLAMMISGGTMGVGGMIAGSTAVFGAGKYAEMNEQAPNMSEQAKVFAAATNGALEGIFETYLGSGAVGSAIRNVVVRQGRNAATNIVKKGIRQGFVDLLIKHPALAPLGEGFEEMGTQIAQNYVDKISGYKPDINIMDGVIDAGLIGTLSGGLHSAPLYAAKAISGKEKATPEGTTLTVNPEQAAEAKKIRRDEQINNHISGIQDDEGNVTTVDIDGQTFYVKNSQDLGKPGATIFVRDAEGNVKPVNSKKITQWTRQTPEEVKTDIINEDAFIEAEKQRHEAEIAKAAEKGVVIGAEIENEFGTGTVTDISKEGIVTAQDEEGKISTSTIEETAPVIETPEPAPGEVNIDELSSEEAFLELSKTDPKAAEAILLDDIAEARKLAAELRKEPGKRSEKLARFKQADLMEAEATNLENKYLKKDEKLPESVNKKEIPEIKLAEIKRDKSVNEPTKEIVEPESSQKVEQGVEGGEQKLQTLEVKKADIERRRNEELIQNYETDKEIELKRFYEWQDSPAKNGIIKQWEDNYEANHKAGIEIINAKYDAELAQLNTTNENTEEKSGQQAGQEELLNTVTDSKNPSNNEVAGLVPTPELTDEQKVAKINRLIDDAKYYDKIQSNHHKKKAAAGNDLQKLANSIGYSIGKDSKGKTTVFDENKKPVTRKIAVKKSQDEIQGHKALTDYSQDFQDLVNWFAQDINRFNQVKFYYADRGQIESGIKNIQAGTKTVAANNLLDDIEGIFNKGEISFTDGFGAPLSEFQAMFITEEEIAWELIVNNNISESELNELFLDYENDNANNEGAIPEDGEPDSNQDGQEPIDGNEGNEPEVERQNRDKELRDKLKSQEKELSKAQSAYTNASTKHAKLADKLKSDEFGNRGQADIFGNNGAQRAGVLDFGNVQDEMAAAKQAVSEAKKEVERLGQEVNRIAKAIEKTRDEIRNQQEIKFEETPKPKSPFLDERLEEIKKEKEELTKYESNPENYDKTKPLDVKQLTKGEKYLTQHGSIMTFERLTNKKESNDNDFFVDPKGVISVSAKFYPIKPKDAVPNPSVKPKEAWEMTREEFVNENIKGLKGYELNRKVILSNSEHKQLVDRKANELDDLAENANGKEYRKDKALFWENEAKQPAISSKAEAEFMVNWLKPNNVVEEKPVSEDKKEETPKEYKYHLTLRPFDIGTYPRENFVRFEDDGTRFGALVYSEPVPQERINHFSLSPITEVESLNGKTIYSGDYPWVLELKKNPRGYYYFEAVQYDNGEEVDRMNLSAEEVLRNISEGRYTMESPEVQSPEKGEEQIPIEKPKTSFTDKVKKGLNEDEAKRLDELRAKLRGKLGNLNAGLDPETFLLAAETTALVIKSGVRQFSDFVVTMVDMLGENIKPELAALYEYTRRAGSREFANEMTPTAEVDNTNIDEVLQQFDENNVNLDNNNNEQDVSDRPGNSEQDSPEGENELPEDGADVQGNRGRSRNYGSRNKGGSRKGNGRSNGGKGGSGLFTFDFGEQSDNELPEDNRDEQPENDDAGNVDGRGNSLDSTEGLDDEQGANDVDNQNAETVSESFKEQSARKLKQQKAAEKIPVKTGDIDNIRETLPFLLDEQQDDVLKAETRFFDPKHQTKELAYGKGILFTNGTGTGKTYTGLGIVKRFVKQGKTNILIVVPSQPKVSDWANDGNNLGLNITPLPDTKTGGTGAVVTTYANFVENQELAKRDFDLIIYDESHRLMEEKNGETSARTTTHYGMSNRSQWEAEERLKSVHPAWIKNRELLEKLRRLPADVYGDMMEVAYADLQDRKKKIQDELARNDEEIKSEYPALKERAAKAVENTKVVFLSATPFKGHFNLRYANGILFDWGNETTYEQKSVGWSRVNPEGRFFLDNFGAAYEWKNNQLQSRSNANAEAIALQEVQFAEKLMAQGVVSGRAINSERDYERAFPKVNGMQTEDFNQAFADIYNYNTKEFEELRNAAGKVFYNYNYTTQLLESLRTSMSIDRIRKHLDLGRKVVVFHRRKQAQAGPPFAAILSLTRADAVVTIANPYSTQEQKDKAALALQQADAFETKYSDLLAYEKTLNYSSAIDQIASEFGSRAAYINGDVSKGEKSRAIKNFNTDGSGVDIIVVQEESGKEGISLHDTSGNHQRVLMSMSMPISSTTALQIEGRIYRIGQETDAIFEYPLLGLDLEVEHFGRNINRKLSTTENLAVGEQSRDLIRSFAEGVLFNSDSADPNPEQGKGGKEYDKRAQQEYSEFRRAVLVYDSNQKKRGRRDQREGIDYYATPEPIGQKMVEWLGLRPNETGLEPSAGHGAISMWFPNHSKLTAIEPSYQLFSKLNARSGGGDRRIINDTFENLDIINKYDGIAMNPPFGSGGKTAIDHLEKAFKHLKPYGRIVALIPNGGSTQKRFDNFINGTDENGNLNHPDAYIVAEITLPSSTFEQAGTSVNTKIVVIDKIPPAKSESEIRREVKADSTMRIFSGGIIMTPEEIEAEVLKRLSAQKPTVRTQITDLTYAENIKELFDEIEFIDVNPRIRVNVNDMSEAKTPAAEAQKSDFSIFEQKDSRDGTTLYMANPTNYLERDKYKAIESIAKKHNGYFNSYENKAKNVKKGFLFKNENDRIEFIKEVGAGDNINFNMIDETSQSETTNSPQEIISTLNAIQSKAPGAAKMVIVANKRELLNAIEEISDKKDYDEVKNKEGKVRGLYHRPSDTIFINMEHVNSVDEGIALWVHENGWHKGIRNIVPSNELVKVFELIYDSAIELAKTNPELQKIVDHVHNNYNGKANQGNEIAAYIAGKMVNEGQLTPVEQTLWEKIQNWVKELLGKIFKFNSELLTEKQIANLIQAAVQSNFQKPTRKDYPFLTDYLEATVNFMTGLWHGSPHKFGKFSTQYMGTGEGAQAFGWGLYFTDKEGIAKKYAEAGGQFNLKQQYRGMDVEPQSPLDSAAGIINDYQHRYNTIPKAIKRAKELKGYVRDDNPTMLKYWDDVINWLQHSVISDFKRVPNRNLYKVKIHGDKTIEELNFLRWDKPVPNETIIKINKALEDLGIEARPKKFDVGFHGRVTAGMTGREVYDNLSLILGEDIKKGGNWPDWMAGQRLKSDKTASLWLLEQGIDGIQYPSEYTTKGQHEDSFNYVVFDENAIEIEDAINFAIIGETGAANLDKAEEATTRLDNLRVAKEMETSFDEWFNGSKVVDEKGNPKVVYHGTKDTFDNFELKNEQNGRLLGDGFYFTSDSNHAREFGYNVMPVNLSIKNPYYITEKELIVKIAEFDNVQEELKKQGYDGIIVTDREFGGGTKFPTKYKGFTEYVVFDNKQIRKENKSFTPKQILLATGWQRGADGKWRYEVPDGKVNIEPLKELAKNNELANQDVVFDLVTYRKNENGSYDIIMRKKGATKTTEFADYKNVSKRDLPVIIDDESVVSRILKGEGNESIIGENLDEAKEIQVEFTTFVTGAIPITDVVTDPELFKAYPQIKDVVVAINKSLGNGAAYVTKSDGQKVIEIGNVWKQTASSMLHEIQHAIQEIEGFARGGNAETLSVKQSLIPVTKTAALIHLELNPNDKIYTKDGAAFSKLFIESFPENEQRYIKAPYTAYKRLAGETESRNVQTRMDYTPEQRRQTLLEETEDVSRKDQIFIYDSLGASENYSLPLDNETVQSKPKPYPTSSDISGWKLSDTGRQYIHTDGSTWDIPTKGIEGETFDYLQKLIANHRIKSFDPKEFDFWFSKLRRDSQGHYAVNGIRTTAKGDNPTTLALYIYDHLPELDNTKLRINTTLDISDKSQPIIKDRKNAINALNTLVKQFGVPIQVIHSSELSDVVGMAAKRKKGTPVAFYHNGTAYIISDKIQSVSDVKQSYLHEAILHKGLDLLFEAGPVTVLGKAYKTKNELLDEVYSRLSPELITEIANQYTDGETSTPKQQREIAEEALAKLNELEIIPSRLEVFMDSLWKFIKKLVGFSSKQFTRTELHKMLSDHRKMVQKVARGGISVASDPKLNGAIDFFARMKDIAQTETAAFKKWFGNSRVVDENGNPLVVYHSTKRDFDSFKLKGMSKGFFFSTSPMVNMTPRMWDNERPYQDGSTIIPVYLSIQNPKSVENDILDPIIENGIIAQAKKEGHDGLLINGTAYVAFSPTQIKSATGNRGTFDENDPNINFRFRSRNPETNRFLDEWEAKKKLEAEKQAQTPPVTPPKPPVKKDATPEPEQKGGKIVDKTIVTKRTYEGDFGDAIDRELEKKGLTRETQNQKEAEQIGLTIIEMEGLEGALNRVRSGEIGGAPAGAIWHEKLKDISNKMDAETNPEMYDLLAKEYADITEEMGNVATLAGQFSAFFNYIYQTSDLGFNAERLIRDYKAVNNGEISPELEEKFKKLANDFKEVQEKLAAEQLKVKELEEQAAVDAIRNSIERQNRKKAKASDKIREKTDKLIELIDAGKLNRPGIFMAASPASLAWDLAMDTVKTAVKATGRTIEAIAKGWEAIKSTDWYKNLDANKQKQAKNAYFDYFTSQDEKKEPKEKKEKDPYVLTPTGLRIPHSIIRDLVEQGIDNIEDLTQAVYDIIVEDYPEITMREVRDAITGYGHTMEQNQEEIEKEIRKMKFLGRVMSGLEDVSEGKRPQKSGLQRDKPDPDQRAANKQLREAMKLLPIDEERKLNQQKTALDAAKQRLINQIEDLQREIDKGELTPKNVRTMQEDEQLRQLRAARDSKKAEHDAIFNDEEFLNKKRVELTKKAINRRIAELEKRISEQDFAPKVRKEVIADTELIRLRAEKLRIQEEYKKEMFKAKLRNRNNAEKTKDFLWDAWGITRALRATGEFSFVGIQGLINTIAHPIQAKQAFKTSMRFLSSQRKADEWLNNIKSQDWYPAMRESKLAITEPNAELTAREELFYSGWTDMIWNNLGKILGKTTDSWMDLNPLRAIERAAVGYLDTQRVLRYLDGVEMLKEKGIEFNKDNKQAYVEMADVINTFTGRGSIGRLDPDLLTKIFFSPRNWSSVIKTATPYAFIHFGKKRAGAEAWKPSVAQKMALADFSKFVGLTASLVALAAIALNGDDDDDNKVELDPRSTDFGKIKIGDTRIDPWGGRIQQIVLISRLMNGNVKNSYGEVIPIGTPYKSPTGAELLLQMATNKLAPSASMLYKHLSAQIDSEGNRVDQFGEPYSLTESIKENLYPIYWGTLSELAADDITALDGVLAAYSFFGGGVQVYDQTPTKKTERTLKEQTIKKEEFNTKIDSGYQLTEEDKIQYQTAITASRIKQQYVILKTRASKYEKAGNEQAAENLRKLVEESKIMLNEAQYDYNTMLQEKDRLNIIIDPEKYGE